MNLSIENIDNLKEAIDLGNRTFELLNWLEEAIKKEVITVDSAREFITNPITSRSWIIEHYNNLPIPARPESLNKECLEPFINLFSTIGLTSFEISRSPGSRYVPHSIRGYNSSYVDNNYITPVKLTKRDKIKARKDKIHELNCVEESFHFNNPKILEALLDDEQLTRYISLYSYCMLLVKRTNGDHSGKSHLVLWREFAWTQEGSPIKNFKLTEELFLDAKEKIIAALKKYT